MNTGLFIDTNSMYISTRSMGSNRLNYDKIFDLLTELGYMPEEKGRFAYGLQINFKSASFIKFLKISGFNTYFKNVKITPEATKENFNLHIQDMSIKMVTDMLLSGCDRFVIITSNPTFHVVLKELKALGKEVIVLLVQPNERLEINATEVHMLDESFFENEDSVSARQQ